MTSMESSNMTGDFIKRLRDITRMKIIKGILAHETRHCACRTAMA
jgi:hypothetical protein